MISLITRYLCVGLHSLHGWCFIQTSRVSVGHFVTTTHIKSAILGPALSTFIGDVSMRSRPLSTSSSFLLARTAKLADGATCINFE